MLPYIILLVDIFLNMPRSMSLVLLLIVPVLTYVIILFSPVLFISFKIVNPNLLIHIRILYKCVINGHNFQYHLTSTATLNVFIVICPLLVLVPVQFLIVL